MAEKRMFSRKLISSDAFLDLPLTAQGLFFHLCMRADEVDEALQRAFSIDGPVLVDVVVAKEELAIPPQIKLEQAKGFSLYMLRAIISGRGDEVIELAKTNWLR